MNNQRKQTKQPPIQITKQLDIICHGNNFQGGCQDLLKNFNNLKQEENYTVFINDCRSKSRSQKVFQILFKEPNPNMTQFWLNDVKFLISQFKKFTISNSYQWKKLQKVIIQKLKLENQCCQFLSQCQFPQLRQFILSKCEISPIGFSHFSKFQFLNLTELNLSDNNLNKQSVKHLIKAKWNKLQKLILQNCGLQYESFKVLIKYDWKNLKILKIKSNPITDSSIDCMQCAVWTKLDQLNIKQKNIIGKLGVISFAKIYDKINTWAIIAHYKLYYKQPKVIRKLSIIK